MSIGVRTLRTSAESLVKLLQAVSADEDVRVIADAIPQGAALAGVRVDGHALELDIVANDWPDDHDRGAEIRLFYARRIGTAGVASDWSGPIPLGPA